MKEFIVAIAMLMLGIFIYSVIAGPEDSISSVLSTVWQQEIGMRTYTP